MRLFLSSSRDVRKRPATERPRVKDSYEPVRASFTRNTYHHYSRSLRVPIMCFRERRVFLSDDLFWLLGLQSPLFFTFFFRALSRVGSEGCVFVVFPEKNFRRELLSPKCQKRTKKRRRRQTTHHPKRTTKNTLKNGRYASTPARIVFFVCVSPFPSRSRALSSRRVRSDDG